MKSITIPSKHVRALQTALELAIRERMTVEDKYLTKSDLRDLKAFVEIAKQIQEVQK